MGFLKPVVPSSSSCVCASEGLRMADEDERLPITPLVLSRARSLLRSSFWQNLGFILAGLAKEA